MTFLLKEKSLLLHAIHRILIRRAPILEGNGQEGDEEDDAESQGEHPPVDRRTIGEIFEPAGGREVSDRCSKEEADHDDHKILAVKHQQDIRHRCPVDLADADLPLLRN